MERNEKRNIILCSVFILWLIFLMLAIIIIMGDRLIYTTHLVKCLQDEHKSYKAKSAVMIKRQIAQYKTNLEKRLYQQRQVKLCKIIRKFQPKLDEILADRIARSILIECDNIGVDPALVTGLIKVESGFDIFAESKAESIGLMQVRYSVWKNEPELINSGVHGKDYLFSIEHNIRAGVSILHKYYKEAKCNIIKALYRYNTGKSKIPKNVSIWKINYVNKILYYTYQVKSFLSEDNKCDQE